MATLRQIGPWVSFLLVLGVAGPSVRAEDVAKKWRVSFAVGGYNAQDEIGSDAANVLVLTDDEFLVVNAFIDPRSDSDAFGNLDVQSSLVATASAQYAFNKIFILEGSVGYQKGDVGDIEVSAQFQNVEPISDEVPFNFTAYRLPAGDLTRIPIRLTAMARFRPRTKMNPYFGVGIGYSIMGFDASNELNDLSVNMDGSVGGFARVTSAFTAAPGFVSPTRFADLDGATTDIRDTFEWHLAGGLELSLKRAWSLFLDLRWVDASRNLEIGFNGGDALGVAVPALVDFEDSTAARTAYGSFQIVSGGLIDGGTTIQQPREGQPDTTDCGLNPQLCEAVFVFEPDGQLDNGFYYVQGGQVSYDGYSVQFGFRYTF